jgi:UMF1 family MFS transporter
MRPPGEWTVSDAADSRADGDVLDAGSRPPEAVTRGRVTAWALYDFGSSAFNTLIVTFIFNRFFTDVIAGDPIAGTILWGNTLNLSAVAVALLMPVLGAIADYSGLKRRLLVIFSLQAVIFTGWLFVMGPGDAWQAALVFGIANVGFEAANVFYNAFLPDVSTPRTIGRVSGYGYFLGYVGGLICLALGLGMIRGWVPDIDYLHIRATILLVAAWYLVFSLPMFLGVPERAPRRTASLASYVHIGFGRLTQTLRHLRHLRDATWLLVAHMLYNDGLVTLIAMASIYAGAVLGMSLEEVLSVAIVLNVAAGLGALVFGFVDDWIGGKRTLIVTLLGLTLAGAIGVATTTPMGFWIAAILIGIMMGPTQSASRSLLAKLVPGERQAEIFGLYAFSGKMSSLFGPLAYTTALRLTGSHRIAMSTIVVFFIAGLLVLVWVREPGLAHTADRKATRSA